MKPHLDIHPFVGVLFLLTWTTTAMLLDHPLMLSALCIGHVSVLLAMGGLRSMKIYLIAGLSMVPVIVIINMLFNRSGNTVLFDIGGLVGLDARPVTLEAMLYGVEMGIKIIAIMLIFGVAQQMVRQDRAIREVMRWTPKLGLITMMAFVSLPRLQRDMERIATVMACRGVRYPSRNIFLRIVVSLPMWKALLIASLEGSLETGEALHARGFGMARRSKVQAAAWKARDLYVGIICIIGAGLCVWGWSRGMMSYAFFPELTKVNSGNVWLLAFGLFATLLSLSYVSSRRS